MDASHQLKTWLDGRQKTQAEFAREVGCSEAYLSEVINGKKQPSLRRASRMSKLTGNVVPLSAFVLEAAE